MRSDQTDSLDRELLSQLGRSAEAASSFPSPDGRSQRPSQLFLRMRDALAPAYALEREVGAGGTSVVFLARDTALDRSVAIKVVRPELATARMLERFAREARLLANLNHPRIVPVYTAGEANGLYYYVMQYVAGDTLADRLKRRPLKAREALRLGLDLLDALAAAHGMGVVHRDVTARNVFVVDGRAVLSDFGIATTRGQAEAAALGTIGAMPPEQAAGAEATPATDVYAVGALLYAALKGQPWQMAVAEERAAWSGVPRRLARVLRRALQWAPEDRFRDALAFHRALQRAAQRRGLVAAPLLVGVALLGLVVLREQPPREELPQADLAILPFDVDAGDAAIGRNLASMVALGLDGVAGLQLTTTLYSFRWSDREERNSAAPDYSALKARHYVKGAVVQRGDVLEARVNVFEPNGRVLAAISTTGSAGALLPLADSIAIALLRRLHPRLVGHFGETAPLGTRSVIALREFLKGNEHFLQGAWMPAERHFRAAVNADSTFLLARWRLLNVWRWMPTSVPDPQMDLAGLFSAYGHQLGELDRLHVEAHTIRPGKERIAMLKRATDKFPRDGYAALLYADELFHRGPLVGYPLSRALDELERAATLDPYLAPTYEHMAWAAIRLGEQARAARALEQLKAVAPAADEVDVDNLALFQQAYAARFDAANAARQLQAFFDTSRPDVLALLELSSRAGLQVGLPHTQLMLAQLLLSAPQATRNARANAHEAIALAAFTLGRADGFAHIDSAAALFNTAEARLESGEWRLLGRALGWPAVSEADADAARAQLQGSARRPELAARASWALIIDLLARGRGEEAAAAIARFRNVHRAGPGRLLGESLRALQAGARGDHERALLLSASVMSYEAHGDLGDPFARAVLHVKRAEWQRALGNLEDAEAELLWAENQDLVGWPKGLAQSAEVDWTFTVYALLHRSALARERGAVREACRWLFQAEDILGGDPLPALATAPISRAGCT